MNIASDESNDGTTYALAGWVAYPSAWDRVSTAWKEMLSSFTMPDGSTMPSFHAAEIVGRDEISNSRFKGWTFDQEIKVFTAAVDILTDSSVCKDIRPLGCSVVLPAPEFKWIENDNQDSIWILLLTRVLHSLVIEFPDCKDCNLMFDGKQEIIHTAAKYYQEIKHLVHKYKTNKFASPVIVFGDDEEMYPLQVADLITYE